MRARAPRAAACVLLAVAVAGCTGDEPTRVETAAVAPGAVTQTVAAPASVDAAARQDVAAGVPGVVVAVDARSGERVRRGETVVELASSQVELALEQAEAAQAAAESVGGVAVQAGAGAVERSFDAAVARLDQRVRPRLRAARRQAAHGPPAARRAARAAIDAVGASYLSTRSALVATGEALAQQQRGVARSLSAALSQAVAAATAPQVAQARAAAAAAAQQAEAQNVEAPLAGVVELGSAAATGGAGAMAGAATDPVGGGDTSDIAQSLQGLAGGGGDGTLRVGAPVVAGQTLFTVYDLSALYVTADVDEVDVPQVRVGQRVDVLVDALPDAAIVGRVEQVSVAAQQTTTGGVGYPTRIRLLRVDAGPGAGPLSPPRSGLRVGMTASAEIVTRRVRSRTTVPSRALLREGRRTVVFTVRRGVARTVPVRVRALGDEAAAVAGRITPRDRVVVAGYESLADGDPVSAR